MIALQALSADCLEEVPSIGSGSIYIKKEAALDFYAVIALHDNEAGPAIGGCRCIEYRSSEEAVYDAIRLANTMAYKASMANLNHGGGKSVLMKPQHINDRHAYFKTFAQFVNTLEGRYIAAVDSGTSPADMDIIQHYSPYVVCTSQQEKIGGGASAYTALGVKHAIQAAVKFKLGRDDLVNVHIAIQGLGNVGYYLAKALSALGARLTICDIDPQKLAACQQEFSAHIVNSDAIYDVDCDVFAPCALGGILNAQTIARLQAKIVLGASNNQLADPAAGLLLEQRGILYGPDFVVNAGGLIYAAGMYSKQSESYIHAQTEAIYTTIMQVFIQASNQGLSSSELANKLAQKRLKQASEHCV